MANLTKTQVIKEIERVYELIDNLKSDLESFQSDVEFERDDIEPYEGKDDLTPAQEERQEWFDNACDSLGYAVDNLEEALSNLDAITSY